MPPKIQYQASFERLYDEVKPLDFTKSVTKKKFMELIATFLKDEPVEKEPASVEPAVKKKATARKPKKESENEEGETVARKKTVISAPEKKAKKSTSAKKSKNA